MIVVLIVAGAVVASALYPLMRASRISSGPEGVGPGGARGDDDLEAEVSPYRAAVRAGTLCSKCGRANPAGSKYCLECGTKLEGESGTAGDATATSGASKDDDSAE